MTQSGDIVWLLVQILNRQGNVILDSLQSYDLWQRIFSEAERHGLSPLIYWQNRYDQALFPEPIFQKFKQAYLTALGRNRIYLAELDRVIDFLCSHDIKVVLLKGAVFVCSLYEDIGLRPMSDLDILLRKEDIPRVVSLLKQRGYEEPVLHQSELIKQDVTHDVHLRRSQPPQVDIEVHWLLVGGEKFRQKTDMEWFWRRIILLEGRPSGVYTLSPTAHLLYLCGHLGHQHGLGSVGMLWFVDIARFLQKYALEIDWREFLEGAKHLSWSAAAYYTFQAVQTYLLQAPPQTVLEQLKQQMTTKEEKHVISIGVSVPSRVTFAWIQFQQLDNAARVRNIISRLFPSLAFMRQRYGFRSNWQAILCYPIRWVDLTNVLLKHLLARVKAKRR